MKKVWPLYASNTLTGILSLSILIAVGGCGGAPQAPKKTPPPLVKKVQLQGETAYDVCSVPNPEKGKKYPLFFFLSPNGNPRDFYPVQAEVCLQNSCFFGASYNFRNNVSFDNFLPALKASIWDISSRYPIDPKRVYLCGFSGGGMASYVTAYFNPGLIRGVLSNDGALHANLLEPGELKQSQLKAVAILSGTMDAVVTPDYLKQNAKIVEGAGIKVQIFSFEGDHVIAGPEEWDKAMKWLLKES